MIFHSALKKAGDLIILGIFLSHFGHFFALNSGSASVIRFFESCVKPDACQYGDFIRCDQTQNW